MSPCILLAGEPALPLASGPTLLSLHCPTFLAARAGTAALQLLGQHQPRLAIVSDSLDDMRGRDLVSLIRADRALRQLSVILFGMGAPQADDHLANAYFDISAGVDVEAVAERGERLLSVEPRVDAKASVCLGRRSADRSWGSFARAVNLSASGMLLQCRERLAVGEDVTLHFVLPQESVLIAAQGRVVRTCRRLAPPPTPHAFGLEFTSLAPRDQLRIKKYVQEASLPS